jgi:hypothetical protein
MSFVMYEKTLDQIKYHGDMVWKSLKKSLVGVCCLVAYRT